MDFTIVGRISSYVKTKNLTFAAKHKIRTGQTLTNSNGNLISLKTTSTFDKLKEAAKTSSDKAKAQKLRRIKQKLMNGKKLSEEEMGFLRVNDPKLYKKARHAEEAREELKAELKKAKSKSEAREAMTRAMIKASTEAMAELGAVGQGGATGGNFGGVSFSSGGGGEMGVAPVGGAENISASNGSSDIAQGQTAENISVQTSDAENSADKNFSAQKNSDADKKDTPEDIMEKFIMTIRALEDEWAHFTNSDEYKNLPEHTLDADGKKIIRKQIEPPKRKFLEAAVLYRKSMLYNLDK